MSEATENAAIMTKLVLTASYQPLSATRLVASVDVACLPTNTGAATFKWDDGDEVQFQIGEFHEFKRVDLSRIFAKGTVDDVINIIGGTW